MQRYKREDYEAEIAAIKIDTGLNIEVACMPSLDRFDEFTAFIGMREVVRVADKEDPACLKTRIADALWGIMTFAKEELDKLEKS